MNSSSRKDIHRRSPYRLFRYWRAWSVAAAAGEGSQYGVYFPLSRASYARRSA
jgi:hypothetical protein